MICKTAIRLVMIATATLGGSPAEAQSGAASRTVRPVVTVTQRGRTFASIQINVDGEGKNIVGDAANGPTIAVDPRNPEVMVIGWRQFDKTNSNFRQAAYTSSNDGGLTWTQPRTLKPGRFRDDLALAADASGNFYYLTTLMSPALFKSTDRGNTWTRHTVANVGQKGWLTIDKSNGAGKGSIYTLWSSSSDSGDSCNLARSTDGGASFEPPITLPSPQMKWGTLAVGPESRVYLAGATLDAGGHVVVRSRNADLSKQAPVFDLIRQVKLGGTSGNARGPNPGGMLGRVWVAVDHSSGRRRGNVYVLASVDPPGEDPMDVMFVRSSDGGKTWGNPVRVNDDAAGGNTWQWFGMMSVAPTGRIDAVWNDTRKSATGNVSELRYAHSNDGGDTWSASIAVSRPFDSFVGYPNQNKIGDHFHMVSDNSGVSVAYSATFNREQDVYFLRIDP